MKKIFAANWKLHISPREAREFFEEFQLLPLADAELIFFPSAISAEAVSESLKKTPHSFGLQHCHWEESGAFTGENSMKVLKELGGKYVLIGHSERRSLFGESDIDVNRKARKAQNLGLTPLICIGESLEEREQKKTFRVLETQLELATRELENSFVIAYEPVWAIGTGQVASAEQVAEAHQFIAEQLEKKGFSGRPLLYGGSVKPENAAQLLKVANVHGFLIGGASLKPEILGKIIQSM